ncbi:enterochelin esterase domain-containing protein [Corynebacterium argentoratense]|uniref:enterochelin esterase domain-containing protein n=1 Tax=Corynebacterium argentoratense TaxID=42817 RepID=UPI0028E6532F|nr:enterochelin esterase domain-containing protein [Corynebacterium argentoratense]
MTARVAVPQWWAEALAQPSMEVARHLYALEPWGGAPPPSVRSFSDGIEYATLSVLAWHPGAQQVLLHVSNATDAHREDFRPWLMQRLPGTPLFALTVEMPADAIVSYRIADVTGLPYDIGGTRAGWKKVHELGVPDEHNPHRIRTPLGGDASVWYGPDAPWNGWAATEVEQAVVAPGAEAHCPWVAVERGGLRFDVLPGDERVVVLYDGQFLRSHRLDRAMAAEGLGHTVVLVDCGTFDQRRDILTVPDRAAQVTREALAAAREVNRSGQVHEYACEQTCEQAHVIAGQSYGALAVATLCAHYPGLTRAGLAQSGSYWFDPAEDPSARGSTQGHPGSREGLLLRQLRQGLGDVDTPMIIQVGSEEGGMRSLSQAYFEVLQSRRAPHVIYREVRGGHDYAWWRHGIIDALKQFDAFFADQH